MNRIFEFINRLRLRWYFLRGGRKELLLSIYAKLEEHKFKISMASTMSLTMAVPAAAQLASMGDNYGQRIIDGIYADKDAKFHVIQLCQLEVLNLILNP